MECKDLKLEQKAELGLEGGVDISKDRSKEPQGIMLAIENTDIVIMLCSSIAS